jgi:hypothetical protein
MMTLVTVMILILVLRVINSDAIAICVGCDNIAIRVADDDMILFFLCAEDDDMILFFCAADDDNDNVAICCRR